MESTKIIGRDVAIRAKDGGMFSAYMTWPVTDIPSPAVIVIQEIFGVNENMRNICENISRMGYIGICPDLFWRQKPGVDLTDQTDAEWQQAFELYKGFNIDKGIEDLISTLEYLRKQPDCSGKVGSVGYCLGGKLAFLMAARSEIDCSVSYYGVDIESHLGEAGGIKKSLLMHIAEKDSYVPPAAQKNITSTLKKHPHVTFFVYEGVDHAFARIKGKNFNSEAAALANYRTADFLATHLTEPDSQTR